jgi:hypothetical protein
VLNANAAIDCRQVGTVVGMESAEGFEGRFAVEGGQQIGSNLLARSEFAVDVVAAAEVPRRVPVPRW